VFTLVLPRFFGFAPAAGHRDGLSGRSGHPDREPTPVTHPATDKENVQRETRIAGKAVADVLGALRGSDIEAAGQALSDIYLTYFDTLWQFAYRWTRSRDQAEELVHDVFFRVWTRREALELSGEIIAYLRLAVRNQIYKQARHSAVIGRMQRAVEGQITDLPAMGSVVHPETSVEESDIDRIMANALATVTPRDRDVVTMRFVDRMTLDEIASLLGVSKSRVRTILARVALRLAPAFEGLRNNKSE
jgi:RNA polymerase sigma factor (sigma-70 family)